MARGVQKSVISIATKRGACRLKEQRLEKKENGAQSKNPWGNLPQVRMDMSSKKEIV
jgi:hypothetical protein